MMPKQAPAPEPSKKTSDFRDDYHNRFSDKEMEHVSKVILHEVSSSSYSRSSAHKDMGQTIYAAVRGCYSSRYEALKIIVESMEETELVMADHEEGSEEHTHAVGELFAHKDLYGKLVARFGKDLSNAVNIFIRPLQQYSDYDAFDKYSQRVIRPRSTHSIF